jgi:molybdopterin synthase sulfur carrier subunit
MKVTLKFFASVREAVGTSTEVLELPAGVDTVAAIRALLVARGGEWAQALGEGRALRMACNQVMCQPETAVKEGAEVAFFPPVTGG